MKKIATTPALRPVSRAVQQALGELPSGPFNFGLYFHKWFYVVHGTSSPQDRWKRSSAWACTMADETKLIEKRKGEVAYCEPNHLLDNFDVSLALFNGSRSYRRPQPVETGGKYKEEIRDQSLPCSWDRRAMAAFLQQKHQALDAVAQSFTKLGFEYCRWAVPLQTPLILGLGDEHPTEKGFRFDWTLGIPFIPASSLKGVVRLAWLVDRLRQCPDEETAREFAAQVQAAPAQLGGVRLLFGSGGEKDACRGRVIFLDAYPLELPRLKPEIMTCHYRDYYEGRRGPTENQQPNPQKFWAVDPCRDDAGTQPLKFVFRLLLAQEISRDESRRTELLQALRHALAEHGLGAKTAIGHGRFGPPARTGSAEFEEGQPKKEGQQAPAEVWKGATLSWDPGSATLTATWQGKKAYLKGREQVREVLPEGLYRKVVDKRKSAAARVTVAAEEFHILKVEPLS